MTKRLCFAAVLALIAPAPTNAQSNAVVLSCQYDATVDRSNPAAIGVVPGVVEISQDLASARLDGVQVSAEKVGEVVLTFSMKDWVYSLNRVTGELTFHSPKGLERWSRLRLQTLQSAALRGIDVAKAELELQELHKKSFDMQQHSASCRPVEKRLF